VVGVETVAEVGTVVAVEVVVEVAVGVEVGVVGVVVVEIGAVVVVVLIKVPFNRRRHRIVSSRGPRPYLFLSGQPLLHSIDTVILTKDPINSSRNPFAPLRGIRV
jgi:hypothetical protein